jgi:hypothetical protein
MVECLCHACLCHFLVILWSVYACPYHPSIFSSIFFKTRSLENNKNVITTCWSGPVCNFVVQVSRTGAYWSVVRSCTIQFNSLSMFLCRFMHNIEFDPFQYNSLSMFLCRFRQTFGPIIMVGLGYPSVTWTLS